MYENESWKEKRRRMQAYGSEVASVNTDKRNTPIDVQIRLIEYIKGKLDEAGVTYAYAYNPSICRTTCGAATVISALRTIAKKNDVDLGGVHIRTLYTIRCEEEISRWKKRSGHKPKRIDYVTKSFMNHPDGYKAIGLVKEKRWIHGIDSQIDGEENNDAIWDSL